jgi:rubrerythrin
MSEVAIGITVGWEEPAQAIIKSDQELRDLLIQCSRDGWTPESAKAAAVADFNLRWARASVWGWGTLPLSELALPDGVSRKVYNAAVAERMRLGLRLAKRQRQALKATDAEAADAEETDAEAADAEAADAEAADAEAADADPRSWRCSWCGEAFATHSARASHWGLAAKIRLQSCRKGGTRPLSGGAAAAETGAALETAETGGAPKAVSSAIWRCSWCGSSFRTKYNRDRHWGVKERARMVSCTKNVPVERPEDDPVYLKQRLLTVGPWRGARAMYQRIQATRHL